MGSSRRHKSKKKYTANTSSSSSSSSFSSDSEDSLEKRSTRRHKDEKYKRSGKESGREKKKSKRDREHGKSKRRRDEKEKRTKEEKRKKKRVNYESDSSSSNDDESELPKSSKNPEIVLSYIMNKFPEMLDDLKQLLNMIDDGQAVDTRGIPNKTLVKILRKLFLTLNLKETESGVFFLPRKVSPTLEVIGPIISSHLKLSREEVSHSESPDKMQPPSSNSDSKQTTDQADKTQETESVPDDNPGPRRRVIGPEMPSAELLAAAAKLTEAEAELRDAEVETDDGLFIGPPPPALVAEAASANEAERFEEVTRIMGVEIDSPYDVVGVNWKMSSDNIKKRYWKLSLMVHPDKCSHPQAHQAFIKLNKAFKELQDPEKRKATDEKLEQEEEKAKFKIELKAMREAAQWRRLQGISLAGDDELLEEIKLPPTRDEWMTTLPPEKKPGPPSANMQSTTAFSRNAKEGRGDTSAWTDNPLEKAQRAKMNYLEAYDKAAALAANEETKRTNPDADLVDQYNSVRRSKSLVQKHQEESSTSRPKKKSKVSKQEAKKGEWEGQHPWKPWDREKDLTAGRQKVNLDAEGMVEGLTSRFSSGTIQRNFL